MHAQFTTIAPAVPTTRTTTQRDFDDGARLYWRRSPRSACANAAERAGFDRAAEEDAEEERRRRDDDDAAAFQRMIDDDLLEQEAAFDEMCAVRESMMWGAW